MITRILHFSDLHFGAREDPAFYESIGAFVERAQPELIVATGDLTNRGLPAQHDRAAAFQRGLGAPVVAVPGNHDIPSTCPVRFPRPGREFDRGCDGRGAISRAASATRSWRGSRNGSQPHRPARFGSSRSTIR